AISEVLKQALDSRLWAALWECCTLSQHRIPPLPIELCGAARLFEKFLPAPLGGQQLFDQFTASLGVLTQRVATVSGASRGSAVRLISGLQTPRPLDRRHARDHSNSNPPLFAFHR